MAVATIKYQARKDSFTIFLPLSWSYANDTVTRQFHGGLAFNNLHDALHT